MWDVNIYFSRFARASHSIKIKNGDKNFFLYKDTVHSSQQFLNQRFIISKVTLYFKMRNLHSYSLARPVSRDVVLINILTSLNAGLSLVFNSLKIMLSLDVIKHPI